MNVVRQAGGVVILGDKVVLRRTRAGEWVFPKGHIEAGETAEEAARREIEEELGLRASALEPLDEVRFQRDDNLHQVEIFLSRAEEYLPTWPAHCGVDAFCFPVSEVGDKLSFDNLRQFWKQVLPRVMAVAGHAPEERQGAGD